MIFYNPNYCSECGEKVEKTWLEKLRDGSFCENCAVNFRLHRFLPLSLLTLALFSIGYATRSANTAKQPQSLLAESKKVPSNVEPLNEANRKPPAEAQTPNTPNKRDMTTQTLSGGNTATAPIALLQSEAVYICGAKTKKGTPCSRRVKKPDRCFQHIGLPPMISPDKLLVKR